MKNKLEIIEVSTILYLVSLNTKYRSAYW